MLENDNKLEQGTKRIPEIICILDKSGSMTQVQDDMIGAYQNGLYL